MPIRRYNERTVPKRSVYSDSPQISLSLNTGKIWFNPFAKSLLNVEEGDQVEFVNDPDADRWYVAKVQKNGFVLKAKKDSMSAEFSRTTLIKVIFDSISFTGNYGSVTIGSMRKIDGMACWELNLDSLLNK
jgi:hypothetical protein